MGPTRHDSFPPKGATLALPPWTDDYRSDGYLGITNISTQQTSFITNQNYQT